jgi:hypothetical protein
MKTTARGIVFRIVPIFLIVLGALCVLWSLVCFIGGPDGKIGSKESIITGSIFLISGSIFLFLAKRIRKK